MEIVMEQNKLDLLYSRILFFLVNKMCNERYRVWV